MSSLRKALQLLVQDVGGDEAMSLAMWPNREPRHGARLIRNWLNAERRHKPDLEDIEAMLWVARLRGHHNVIAAICESLNYTAPQPVDPKARMHLLQQSMQQHQRAMQELTDAMIRAQRDIDAIACAKQAAGASV